MNIRKFLSPLLLIILAASGVSLFTLFNQSIRLDESQSIWLASKPVDALLKLTSEDVHVPLYSAILHLWMQLFGTNIVVVRLLSLIFFAATLPVLYKVISESSNRKIALLTVAFFAFSPFIIWYTSEARMYTLFTFVTSINHLFFLRFFQSEGKKGKLGYFLSLIAGFYTHYFFLFLVATQIIFVFSRFAWQVKKDMNTKGLFFHYIVLMRKGLPFQMALIIGGAFIFFLPWVWYVLQQGGASNTQPLIPPPTSYNIFQTFVNFLFGFQTQGIQALLVSLWPLSVITLFFIFTKRQRVGVQSLEYFVIVTFLPILLVFLISFFRPIFLSRYLILVTPTLFFLLAWLLLSYSKRLSTYLATGVLVIMFGLLLYQNTSAATPVKENYRGLSQYLSGEASPEDIIAVSAPFTVYPIEYSYQGSARITTIPVWDRYTEGSIPPFSVGALDRQIQKYRKQYSRIFVVLSYDQGYEKQIITYFDSKYELLNTKKFSEGIQTRVYKLRYDIE